MKTAKEIQRDVLAELAWEPSLDAAGIGVGVHDGVVTLSGHVRSYAEKRAAEQATKRVAGVEGVAERLTVSLPTSTACDDTEIAEMIVRNLRWNTLIPADRVTVTVEEGWVVLDGTVEWSYQLEEVEKTVAHLAGVKGVSNFIRVEPAVTPNAISAKITEAFRRSAEIDASGIGVETYGTKVLLTGRVGSWTEHEQATWAAWSAPGVTEVENRLRVKAVQPVGV